MSSVEHKTRDEEVVRAVKSGDRLAFEELIRRHFGMVYAIGYARLKHREAAEDLAQEAFIRAYVYIGSFQEHYTFANWLVRIAHNLANTWNRKGQRASNLVSMIPMEEIRQEIADSRGMNGRERMNIEEENRALYESVFQLPEEQREILLLHYMEELSQKEIAERLNLHPSTVSRQLTKALSGMRGLLVPMLRESIRVMRAPQKARVRTIALLGAVAAMSAHAKLSIAQAAGGAAWIASISGASVGGAAGLSATSGATLSSGGLLGVLKAIPAAIAAGGKFMLTQKGIVTVIAVSVLTISGIVYLSSDGKTIGPASTVSAIAAPTPSPGTRVLHFPSDRSLGKIKVMEDKPVDYYMSALPDYLYYHNYWDVIGEARGDVAVPLNKLVRLDVNENAQKDLSPLLNLGPDDLDILIASGSRHKLENSDLRYFRNLTGLRYLSLGGENVFDGRGLQAIKDLKSLKILSVASDNLGDDSIDVLANIPSLEVLSLHGKKYTDEGLRHLSRLPSLRELALVANNLKGPGLAYLKQVPTLRLLMLYGQSTHGDTLLRYLAGVNTLKRLECFGTMNITDSGLHYLSNLTDLEWLECVKITGITDKGLVYLKPLTKLKHFNAGSSQVTENGILVLKDLKDLEYLHLPYNNMTDKSLSYVTAFPKLKYLWLGNYSNSPITDAGIKNLEKLPELEELYFSGTGITDEGMSSIAKLSNLRKIGIFSVPQLTNKGMAKLTSLKHLTSIECLGDKQLQVSIAGINYLNALPELDNIKVFEIVNDDAILDLSNLKKLTRLAFYTKQDQGIKVEDLVFLKNMPQLRHLYLPFDVTDEGMRYLENLVNLEYLYVGGPEMTDKGLQCLANMQKIQTLQIGGNFTDEGLKYLERLSSLSHLMMKTSGSISSSAVERLRRNLPNLVIFTLDQNRTFKKTSHAKPPRYAPSFAVTTLTGKTIRLEQYRGKVVLLYFWSTWCKPCTESMPRLKELYEELRQFKDFEMISFSLDADESRLRKYVLENGIKWTQVRLGEMSKVGADYGIVGVPDYFLLGTDGRVILDKKDDWKNLKEVVSRELKQKS